MYASNYSKNLITAEEKVAELMKQRDAALIRAEKAEAALADWSVLKGWGGTPEIVHKFVKGQQHRIHHCQDLEAELATERARLDWLASPQGRLWQRQNESALVCRDTIDAAMKEDGA